MHKPPMDDAAHLAPYTRVRVRHLLKAADAYDGWGFNQRPPNIGDIGTIIEIFHAPEHADLYVVEALDQNGSTIWLANFASEELEAVR